ncbi:hypothetical protein OG689_36720 [Kitasatospora sp. NBC_00240]|uniref:hypothetical protein n=1 Tax=Kitasatospora sp. NBC_00240 TaxID=2903567 RepID=UPI0022565887|nr:hypothetical protein [Kitasatospora sp. NBC_00240]MCX5214741.1 hypothetical protein [Kitasatospora sp. NBC_00240]
MSPFDLSPPGARPPAAGDAVPLQRLRRAATRSRRRFLGWNIGCFAVVLLLPHEMGSSVAAGIGGGLTVSILLFLTQAVLLLVTAHRFDRDVRTHCDPLTEPPHRTDGAGR